MVLADGGEFVYGTVPRTFYVREVAVARRGAMRRSRMAAEFFGALRAALDSRAD